MSKFLSSRHAGLEPYVPGEQPTDTQYIKLNTNESPYPPSPSVLEAISKAEIAKLNLYPNPDGVNLVKKLSEFYDVEQDNIIIGNGSDELLAFAFQAFCDEERPVVFPNITYGFYPVYAQLYGIPYEQIPLTSDFKIDIEDYCGINKNIVIANPNAPTGIALTLDEIEKIAQSNPNHIVLIDEAYVDFGATSAIPLTEKYDNLLIMHTYSKSRSMAGARLAYAVAQAPIIEDLKKMRFSFNPYSVNRLTQIAGVAALVDNAYYTQKHGEIIATREYTETKLKELGFEMTDSSANFVFAKHSDYSGYELYTTLKKMGILVRNFNKPIISEHLRITIGTKEQMDALIEALSNIIFGR